MSNQKIVTEAALSAIASDIKNALSGKANSNDVYTKTEIDNALELKADKSELYNVYPTDQESGSIAHITDGADNIPVKSLVSQIVAVESGNGEKSPDNPYTISGFDSGVVSVSGKNLIGFPNIDFTIANMRFYSDGTAIKLSGTSTSEISSINTNFKNNFAFTLPAGDYYVSVNSPIGVGIYLRRYSDNTQLIAINPSNMLHLTETTKIYFGLYIPNNKTLSDHNTQFNITIGNTATTYEAYNGNTYTFTFGQTVYGGHFDNKGNLVVTHRLIEFDYTSAWAFENSSAGKNFYVACDADIKTSQTRENMICNVSPVNDVATVKKDHCIISAGRNFNFTWGDTLNLASANDFKTYLQTNNIVIKVIAELVSPITLAITSQNIPTLLGENNIFSNTGDVEVEYHADIGLYIDKKVSSLAQG